MDFSGLAWVAVVEYVNAFCLLYLEQVLLVRINFAGLGCGFGGGNANVVYFGLGSIHRCIGQHFAGVNIGFAYTGGQHKKQALHQSAAMFPY